MANKQVVEIKKDIFWVGSVDWNIRDFHGFTVPKGVSYNAYFINGSEPTLIDTVKEGFGKELISKISQLVDPVEVVNIIVNHIEPDHSGSFEEILKVCPKAKIYASEVAKIGLEKYYNIDREINIVRTGDEITVGGKRIQFVEIPMAHWPDSMVSYLPDEKVLFSSDAFGQFIATSERFDYELDPPPYEAASVYYANIILPFNHYVVKTVEALTKYDVKPEMILPDHGIIWTKHIPDIFERYVSWATGSCAKGVLILYDTMWKSTEIMSEKLYDEIIKKGVDVKKMKLRNTPLSEVINAIMHSKVVLIGSPTMNDTIFPSIGTLLAYIQGLNPGPNRLWGAFGSYGWGGGAVDHIMRFYKENQYEIVAEPVEAKFRADDEETLQILKLAEAVVNKVIG
jgi:anaerobic nitric oxide reductase flavorubredoxin